MAVEFDYKRNLDLAENLDGFGLSLVRIVLVENLDSESERRVNKVKKRPTQLSQRLLLKLCAITPFYRALYGTLF